MLLRLHQIVQANIRNVSRDQKNKSIGSNRCKSCRVSRISADDFGNMHPARHQSCTASRCERPSICCANPSDCDRVSACCALFSPVETAHQPCSHAISVQCTKVASSERMRIFILRCHAIFTEHGSLTQRLPSTSLTIIR